ncbi:MAG: response regulator [Parvularculaceae bacterium]
MAEILIIEDEAAMAMAISFVLDNAGHTTQTACDAPSAKKILATSKIDCAICDVWLGNDDGLDLFAKLRSDGVTIPFVIVSGGGPGRTLEAVTTRADMLGAIGILFKPFGDDELLDVIDIALNKKSAQH